MRRMLAVTIAVVVMVVSCGGEESSTNVLPEIVSISGDRRTVVVVTAFPIGVGCAKEPAGLELGVNDDSVVVKAAVGNSSDATRCTLECGQITQSLTVAEPLPPDVEFRFPNDADPGCARGSESDDQPSITSFD